jgi:hypothetical protein
VLAHDLVELVHPVMSSSARATSWPLVILILV